MKRKPILIAAALFIAAFLCLGFAIESTGPAAPAYRYLSLFTEVLGLVRGNYVDEVDQDILLKGAYQGMVGGLDAYSAYVPADEFRAISKQPVFPADTGADVIKSGGTFVVVSVVPGSPAEGAGLMFGDQIWYIDGKATRSMSLMQGRRNLSGADGSEANLTIFHVSEQKRTEQHVKRVIPKAPAFEARLEAGGIGYMKLRDPARADRPAVTASLLELEKKGAKQLLIDLRGTTRGSMDDAVRLAGLFIGDATVARSRERGGEDRGYTAKGPVVWKAPIWVLVNQGTAGAGEIMAACLRDDLKAKLVGAQTCGLAARQDLIPLPSGDGLILSTAKYLAPSGETWYEIGLKVDVPIPLSPDDKPSEAQERQLRRALEIVAKGDSETAKAA